MAIWLVILFLERSFVQLFQAERTDEVFGVKFTEHGRNAATRDGLVAARTQRATLCMVMGLAVRHAFMVKETSSIKGRLTIPTNKTLRVPLSIQCRNVIFHDGSIATATLGSKHFEIVGLAIGFAILFVETFFAELVATLSTKEVFWVPGLVQGRHTFIEDGTVTVGTSWRKQVVIIAFAVWLPITLEEVLSAQFLLTVNASEMLWMPGFCQSSDYLSNDWLATCCATSLLSRVNALAAHVRLQGS